MDITEDLKIGIGKNISSIRLKNQQTQQDIEFLCGIDAADVSKYESGQRNLTLKTLGKFVIALGVQPKELFDFEFDLEKYNEQLDK